MIDVLYFAWVRERVGAARESIDSPATTVAELIDDLRGRDARYAAAFADTAALRCAVDQELTGFDAPITAAREVAFFPPMTGG
ncbi:molybdopterin converting factor subunit 1 [Paracoccus sp. p4-l81]|uniref:molybdopterin converting factor subunit 1 n=1 Tax=unclassified Paracoccus (in: a-proteobacteria) TaxID=2688777 RepID=UPI0035BB2835